MKKLLSSLTALVIVLGVAATVAPAQAQTSYNWNEPNNGGGSGD